MVCRTSALDRESEQRVLEIHYLGGRLSHGADLDRLMGKAITCESMRDSEVHGPESRRSPPLPKVRMIPRTNTEERRHFLQCSLPALRD